MNIIPLRTALVGSQIAPPDVIGFAGSLSEHCNELSEVVRDIYWIAAKNKRPGEGTLSRVETIVSHMLQTVEAYRLASPVTEG